MRQPDDTGPDDTDPQRFQTPALRPSLKTANLIGLKGRLNLRSGKKGARSTQAFPKLVTSHWKPLMPAGLTTRPPKGPTASDPTLSEPLGTSVSRGAMLATVAAAFGTYFCVYGFRKPFTAGSFSDSLWLRIEFKDWLVISQGLGYMTSKFIGIKVIAEMPPRGRARGIVTLVLGAQLALLAFAWLPRPMNVICLFANGLALGMIFGLVLGFLEGRRCTEALAAGLCTSFIVADGVTKSVGAWLLDIGISEAWMPAAAGGLFLPPLLLSVWALSLSPPPDQGDLVARSVRNPLNRQERWSLYGRYAFGLTVLVAVYLMVTVLRSLRADFAPQLWSGLAVDVSPGAYTRSELWVALGVIALNGGAIFILNNRRAFFVSLFTCMTGFVLMAATLLSWRTGLIGGFTFMVLIGLGLYLPYVAIHTTVFERLLAMTRERGNLGFLMYVADAFGYLGYVGVMISRNLFGPVTNAAGGGEPLTRDESLLAFFLTACWLAVGICGVGLIAATIYFAGKRPRPAVAMATTVAASDAGREAIKRSP